MTKLTTRMRDAIVKNAIEKSGINKQRADYAERRKRWAEKVADESIGGAEAVAKLAEANKKVAKIVSTLPEHLRQDLCVGPRAGGIVVGFGGMRAHVHEWDNHRAAKSGLLLAADHPLTKEFELLEAEDKDLTSRKDKLTCDVRAMVNSVTTVKRLLDVWPEAAELLPASAAPKPQLPSVNVEHLNAIIGLPTEETPQ